jgi:serine phosphatase RsbU (regulator of sigma subunit)/Tfp pilus assembly protein PilF
MLLSLLSLDAQDKNIDSLKQELKKAKHDTTRCNLLNELINSEKDSKRWSEYNDQLINLSEKAAASASNPNDKKKYLKHLAVGYNNKSYLADEQGDIDKTREYRNKSLKISEEINDDEGIANSLNHIAIFYDHEGNTEKAIEYFQKSIAIREKIKDQKGLATSLTNIGGVYENQGDIPKGLEYYHRALKIQERINDKEGTALTLNNMGYIYVNQDDPMKALEYYQRALKLYTEIQDKSGIAFTLNNIGYLHLSSKDDSKALHYFNESLKRCEEIDYQEGIASCLNAIGSIFLNKGDLTSSLTQFQRSLVIFEEIGNKYGSTNALKDIGTILLKQGKVVEAEKYANKSLQSAREIGYPDNIKRAASLLKSIYKKQNKFSDALTMYELEMQMNDSISNAETKKASVKKQFQYDYEKKVAADSIKNAEKQKVKNAQLIAQDAQLKQARTKNYALYGGMVLVLVFAGFMVNRFRVTNQQKKIIELKEIETQKQNEIITHQKHLVEEKHKEITDSITYAERIQRSFLASKEMLNDNLPAHTKPGTEDSYFVFFQPKDVVSGDFYWASQLNNGNFALATADSTGHGVPGAIMSILNISCLEKAVEQEKLTEPAEILNHTRAKIIERLKKDGSEEGGKDGMDCSLICFDFAKSKLTYAAANNPVWIVRSNSHFEGDGSGPWDVELIELPSDKMPVGKHDKDQVPFTQHSVSLLRGDMVYTLTDGLPDQFGGPKGKKFMYKQLKELLKGIAHLPMTDQKEKLKNSLDSWKGGLEQVDDICVIGIRV